MSYIMNHLCARYTRALSLALLPWCVGAVACSSEDDNTPAPTCFGTPTPCDLLDESECAASLGCMVGGSCVGSALDCGTIHSETSCELESDCAWLSSSEECIGGSSLPCSSWTTKTGCELTTGCTFIAGCNGTPLSCELALTEAECTQIAPGCTWGEAQ